MAHCCRELFSNIYIATSLDKSVGMPMGDTPINVHVHEENTGALVLARTLSPQFTTRIKYYVTKTIWFHEEIVKRRIMLLKINTVGQIGELFTKGMSRTMFEHLHKNIVGW